MKKTVMTVVALVLLTGCASTYPRPTNKNYVPVKGLWYCYGNLSFPWGPGGLTWIDDLCRIDPCEMNMPDLSCLEERQ